MEKTLNSKIEFIKSGWYVWLFPTFAVAICIWLFFNHIKEQGPQIKISFEDGSSLQPEKTHIRYRGVTIGIVKKVTISEDNKKVIADVLLQKKAEHFAVAGSKFWVVVPDVSFQGVKGLETIIEGSYIAVQPGRAENKRKTEFVGKIGSDNTESLEDTSSYLLETGNAESLNPGDSVTFRGLKIGSITKVTLSKTAQKVMIQINIDNRHVRLIRNNSVFWKKVGVQAKLGLFNSEVKVNSLDSILRGGVEVFTPDQPGPLAKANTQFELQANPPKDSDKWNANLDM